MLLGESLIRSAAEAPEQTALFYRDKQIAYRQLAETVRRLASRLRDLGVKPGDRVAVLMENCPEFVFSYYAATGAGAVAVPTNTFLVNPELDYIFRDAEIQVLLTSAAFAARLQPILARIPSLQAVVVAGADGQAAAETATDVELHDLDALVEAGNPEFPLDSSASASALAVLQYTSGTTGKPKGVMLSHDNLLINAEAIKRATEISTQDRFLLALPLFHSFSQTVCMVTPVASQAGMAVVPKIDRTELGFSLMNHRPTIFPGVPALFYMLSMAPAPPPDKNPVRLYVSGGAPLPRPVQQRFEENYKKPIYEGYGLTEASPVVAWNLPGANRPGSVGRPVHQVQVRVIDEAGGELPAGEVGELCVRAGSVMLGYYRQEPETAETIVDGWLRTGDMSRIDEDGYIYIVERKKELILHKGINVYPSEIEHLIMRRPEVAEAAVVGIHDSAHGEIPEAFLVLHPDKTVSEADLRSLCKENLAAYKVPRRFHFVAQLPKTATGKVRKAELRSARESASRNASA